MNTVDTLNWGTLLLFAASVIIPAISAAVVREKWDTSITGVVTAFLAAGAGFLTEWGEHPHAFEWKTAAVAAFGSWLVASVAQARVYAGTRLEVWLRALGSSALGKELAPAITAAEEYVEKHLAPGKPETVDTAPVDAVPDPDAVIAAANKVYPATPPATADPAPVADPAPAAS